MGIAQTGTGKTAAFSLPIINKFGRDKIGQDMVNSKAKSTRSLILTPTRELASQIMQNIDDYAEGLGLKTKVVYGGVGRQAQVDAIALGLDILVATPGRLLDLIETYANDATMNGLTMDIHKEEQAVELFAANILKAGLTFLENPMERPFIPSWNRVSSALPNLQQLMLDAVAQDMKEYS